MRNNDECSLDESVGVVVHKFDSGKYVCRCGEDNVQEKIDQMKAKYGEYSTWRRRKIVKAEEE